jgi:hypothetical protein
VRVGPDRVRPGPARHELQELIDQLVADPILPLAISTNQAPERRRPHHRTPSCRGTATRGNSSGNQPRRWITRISAGRRRLECARSGVVGQLHA